MNSSQSMSGTFVNENGKSGTWIGELIKYQIVIQAKEPHSTVTDFAKFLGWSTFFPSITAI